MAVSEWDKQHLSADQQQAIQRATDYGEQTGDWETAHRRAEAIRAQKGYSGGGDGGKYIALGGQGSEGSSGASTSDYRVDGGTGYGGLGEYLRRQQAAKTEAELAGLKSAYRSSLAGYDKAEWELPAQYDAARNSAAAQSALAKKTFAEQAAAAGLNSGVSGQAELARSSVLQSNLSGIDRTQADAQADIALERQKLQAEYESAIAAARAEGDATLAGALYQELVRVQGLEREDAQLQTRYDREDAQLREAYRRQDDQARQSQSNWEREFAASADKTAYARAQERAATLAAAGDFSGYKALGYSDGEVAGMRQAYEKELAAAAAAAAQQQRENDLAVAKLLASYGDFSGYKALGVDTSGMEGAWADQEEIEDVEIPKTDSAEDGGDSGTSDGTEPVTYDTMRPKAKEFADRIRGVNPGTRANVEKYFDGLAKEILLAMEEGDISVDEGYYLTKLIGR